MQESLLRLLARVRSGRRTLEKLGGMATGRPCGWCTAAFPVKPWGAMMKTVMDLL